jgi:hypothetical protein
LKAEIVEQKEAATAMQQHGKHVSIATNEYATVEESLEVVSSTQSVPRLYNKVQPDKLKVDLPPKTAAHAKQASVHH